LLWKNNWPKGDWLARYWAVKTLTREVVQLLKEKKGKKGGSAGGLGRKGRGKVATLAE